MRKITESDFIIEVENELFFDDDEPQTRYNGGWAKEIRGLDKSKNNGYSFKGMFIDGGGEAVYRVSPNKLYLDCGVGGSRKNQKKQCILFSVNDEGEIIYLKKGTVNYKNGKTWAIDFWPFIDKFLSENKSSFQNSKDIAEEIKNKNKNDLKDISTDILIKELAIRGYNTKTLTENINLCNSAKREFRHLEID